MSELKTSTDLRTLLTVELKKVTSGQTTPAVANAAANLCGKIVSSVKMELEYCKMVGKTPHIDFIRMPTPAEIKSLENKTQE